MSIFAPRLLGPTGAQRRRRIAAKERVHRPPPDAGELGDGAMSRPGRTGHGCLVEATEGGAVLYEVPVLITRLHSERQLS